MKKYQAAFWLAMIILILALILFLGTHDISVKAASPNQHPIGFSLNPMDSLRYYLSLDSQHAYREGTVFSIDQYL